MAFLALTRLLGGPRLPAGAFTAHDLQRNAVHRAHRQAQLAAGADRFDHGVHALVAAHDRVGRADLDAQRAADAPGLVDHSHRHRALNAVVRVQWCGGQACDGCQAGDALGATRRALVDVGSALGNGQRIARAVGVTATRALGLRQGGVNAPGEFVHDGQYTGALVGRRASGAKRLRRPWYGACARRVPWLRAWRPWQVRSSRRVWPRA